MKHLLKIYNLFLLWLLVNYSSVSGQNLSYRQLSTTEGLIQAQVNTICEDRFNNIWFGTLAGISKYDGKRFFSYTTQDGLAEDWVTSLVTDKEGNIWAGHWGGNVSKFLYQEDYFKTISLKKDKVQSSIVKLICDEEGVIWAASENEGIYRIDPQTYETTIFFPDKNNPSLSIRDIAGDKNGHIVIATEKGIFLLNTKKSEVLELMIPGIHGNSFNDVSFNKHGLLAYSTSTGILLIKQVFTDQPEAISLKTNDNSGNLLNNIDHLISQNDGKIWATTKSYGALSINMNDIPLIRFQIHNFQKGLSSNTVNCIFTSSQGVVWMGTNTGINAWAGEGFSSLSEHFGIADNIVWSLLENQGTIYSGTDHGLSVINTDHFQVKKNLLLNKRIVALCKAGNNSVAASEDGSVYLIENGEKPFIALNKTCYALTGINANEVLIGTKEGLYHLHLQTKTIRLLTENKESVYRLYTDRKGMVWGASIQRGLFQWTSKGMIVKGGDVLGQKFILSFADDELGNIWIGTYNAGLFQYDGQQFKQHLLNDKFYSYTPYSLIMNKDKLWIGTNRGLGVFSPEDQSFFHLDANQGYNGVENNAGAILFSNQTVYLGSIMGLVKFNTKFLDEKINLLSLPYLNHLKVNQSDYISLEKNIFNYDDNSFSFSIHANNQIWQDKQQFQYRVFGMDTSWRDMEGDVILLTKMPPGEYFIQCRSGIDGKHWSKSSGLMDFTIKAPFWKTWWFPVACFVSGIILLIVLIKSRNRQLINDKIELESKVLYQEAELKELKLDELRSHEHDKLSKELIQILKSKSPVISTKINVQLLGSIDNENDHFFFSTQYGQNQFFCLLELSCKNISAQLSHCLFEEIIIREFSDGQFISPDSFMDRFLSAYSSITENQQIKHYLFGQISASEITLCGDEIPFVFRSNNLLQFETIKKGLNWTIGREKVQFLALFTESLLTRKGGQTGSEAGSAKIKSILQQAQQKSPEKQKELIAAEINNWSKSFPHQENYLLAIVPV